MMSMPAFQRGCFPTCREPDENARQCEHEKKTCVLHILGVGLFMFVPEIHA